MGSEMCIRDRLMIVGVGFLIYGVLAIWYIYRVVRGLINYADRKTMPR